MKIVDFELASTIDVRFEVASLTYFTDRDEPPLPCATVKVRVVDEYDKVAVLPVIGPAGDVTDTGCPAV